MLTLRAGRGRAEADELRPDFPARAQWRGQLLRVQRRLPTCLPGGMSEANVKTEPDGDTERES